MILGDAICCPMCGRVSHSPADVEQRYCGACHLFHDEMICVACGGGVDAHRSDPACDCGQRHLVPVYAPEGQAAQRRRSLL
jgi:hypothetical protein